MIVQVVTPTDPPYRQRLRHMMTNMCGNMTENGAVGWIFQSKGDIVVSMKKPMKTRALPLSSTPAEVCGMNGAAWEFLTPARTFETVRGGAG